MEKRVFISAVFWYTKERTGKRSGFNLFYGKKGMSASMDKLLQILNGNARIEADKIAVMLNMTKEQVEAAIAEYEKKRRHSRI